jgi:hypothetical protein
MFRPSFSEDAALHNAAVRDIKKAKFACTEDGFVLLHRTNDAGRRLVLLARRLSPATHCSVLPRVPPLYPGGFP